MEKLNSSSALSELWHKYRKYGDKSARDKLILYYSPLVKYVAARVSTGLPSHIDPSDLASYGLFGLIDAIEKFDIDRRIKFETYALIRIKGAIFDELRAMDWVPRSVRLKIKALDKAYDKLEAQLGRNPTDDELKRELNISESELQNIFKKISASAIVALDDVLYQLSSSDNSNLDSAENPTKLFEYKYVKQLLSETLNSLPERERKVLTLYYFEGFNLSQIGQVLGVTESRACQLHARAILLLKKQLDKRFGDHKFLYY